MVGLMQNAGSPGRNSVDSAEPEMGDDPPSQNQTNQSDSTEPGVVAGEPQSERPTWVGQLMPLGQLFDFVDLSKERV